MILNTGAVTTAVFTCSICGEPSTNICAYCTKDACGNHRCERCKRCSDCCECDEPLSAAEVVTEPFAEAIPEVPSPVEVIELPEPPASANLDSINLAPANADTLDTTEASDFPDWPLAEPANPHDDPSEPQA